MSQTETVFDRLERNGPATSEELGTSNVSYGQRKRGVNLFNPRATAQASSDRSGWAKQGVYYIEGCHDKKDVIRYWLGVNRRLFEDVADRSLHQRVSMYGEEWKEASREVLGPFSDWGNEPPEDHMKSECPFCEDELEHSLPVHLPCEEQP